MRLSPEKPMQGVRGCAFSLTLHRLKGLVHINHSSPVLVAKPFIELLLFFYVRSRANFRSR